MAIEKQRLTFISYSRDDKDFALQLAHELRSSGFLIWFDQLDIPTGSRWDDEVEKALVQCEIFMVILTPNSIASNNVKDEIGYAIDSNKRIMPVLLQNANVPFRLRRFQYVDFTKKTYEEGIQSAKQLLRNLVNEPTLPGSSSHTLAQSEGAKALLNRIAQNNQANQTPQVREQISARQNRSTTVGKADDPRTSPTNMAKVLPISIGTALLSVACMAVLWFVWANFPAPSFSPTVTLTTEPQSPTQTATSIPSQVPSSSPTPNTTSTTEPAVPNTFTATVPATLIPESVERIFFDSSRTHIGDEDLDQSLWTPLLDECYDQPFDVSLPIDSMLLAMRVYDTDADNSISINDIFLAYIPNQDIPGDGFWDSLSVTIPQNYVQAGANRLTICTGLISSLLADHENDKDDIQLQAIEITVQR